MLVRRCAMEQIDEIRTLLDEISGDDEVEIHDLGEIGYVVPLSDLVVLLENMRERTLEEAGHVAEEHAHRYTPDGAGYEAGYKSASVDIQRAVLSLDPGTDLE